MVYIGPGSETARALWIKDLDQLQLRRLAGTEGAWQPFFSPDGQRVGFIASNEEEDRVLKVLSVEGGPPLELADSGFGRGGPSWSADGFIYVTGSGGPLVKVPETGGEVAPVTLLAEDETQHLWPDVLPNGRGVIFTVMRNGAYDYTDASIAVADLTSGDHRDLIPGVIARYTSSGHLVVVDTNGTLFVAPFDQDDMVVGEPVPIAEGVLVGADAVYGAADIAVSANGILLYVAGRLGAADRELVWVERDGSERPIDPSLGLQEFGTLALSPDDRRLAVSITADVEQLWVKELPDGPLTRLTTDEGRSRRPVWSADGRTITYITDAGGPAHARRVRSDGSDVGTFEVLLEREDGVYEVVYTPNERGLVFRVGDVNVGAGDLDFVDMDADSVNAGLLASDFNESAVALSPDGRWMAYVSDVTGRNEVFVRPFPSVDLSRTQISTNGGVGPVWAHNGRELFYRDLSDGWLTAASYTADSTFVVDERERLFDASGYHRPGRGWHHYDVTQDDRGFVFIRVVSERVEDFSLIFVQNWFTELEERLGGGR